MKHPFDVHVGEKIRQSRRNLKLSEAELAVMLGVSPSQIQAFEAGMVRVDPELMRQVVNVLDVPATFYFEGLATALRTAA
ncbi:MAG: helix-turn-helix domain-containing protein [Paracoccaceae bacterium]|nr:helix-turn-helix domain-containing protein [Paracoccaceae bacterium]